MGRRNVKDGLVYAVAAAYLRSSGMLQKEIARTLEIEQPDVSRYLKEAEGKGWLKYLNPQFMRPVDQDRHLWDEADARFFGNPSILARLKTMYPEGAARLRRLTVLQGDADEEIPATVVDTIQTLLSEVEIVGVTWGRTISGLVATLGAHITSPPRAPNPIQFVPLCGEPLIDRFEPIKYSSSALAVQFSNIFNGRDRLRPPSLAGVPAFIPSQFQTRSELRTIRRFLRQVAGYASVMDDEEGGDGQPEHWVNRLGAILTSAGVVEKEQRGIFLQERIQTGDITEAELNADAVGDMGGIIIPRGGLTAEQTRRIDALNQRWTGIKQRHIEHCAETAGSTRPGVILFGVGAHRCHVVLRCIALGLVNEVIMDRSLARALEAEVGGPDRSRATVAVP